MSDYDDSNSGSMFKNDKGDNPRRPDYRGSINVNGVKHWLSGWIRTAGPNAKNPGEQFISLSIESAEQQQKTAIQPATAPTPQNNDFDQDLPF